ncbi:hypothetical protein XENOCAPTIV_021701 [Xenoophorus captivus]|uniref:Microtubule-associated protein 1B/S N-terminal domain-containing protein n=1 Tax=Xenoophorus captivus TaxID=1517983 RepID=A0ABV0R9W5_9TELE
MAAQRGGGPGSSQPAAAADHSVLVVVGSLQPSGLLELVLRQIEAGVRCWQVGLDVPVLDQQLKLFVSRHSAFLSEDVRGEEHQRSMMLHWKWFRADPQTHPTMKRSYMVVDVVTYEVERQQEAVNRSEIFCSAES